MVENKRYSADKMREVADMFKSATNPIAVCFCDKDGWHPNYIECHVEQMLRQAADAEEELVHLREERTRLAAMVERCEELHAKPYGISDDDYNYILKGATNGTKR